MKTQRIKIKPKMTLPRVTKSTESRDPGVFPLSHYSYSTFVSFSTNPILFKIRYINHETIETTRNVSGVIGQAFHNAMDAYYSALSRKDGSDALKEGLEGGMAYLEAYEDGFIEYSESVKNKQKAHEILAFSFNAYVQHKRLDPGETLVSCEELLEAEIDVEWRGKRLKLPVPLKGYLDKLVRDEQGRLKIKDYKTVRAFADPEKIDGAKILQAVQYYLLVHAKYGEAPYSMTYEEVKVSKNRDGSPQVREYEMVFAENDLFFDFYFRFYDDVTRAINGEAVFVPNIYSFFDNEVAIVAYINRLDVGEEASRLMRKLQVQSITDLLKNKIEHAGSMRKFLRAAEKKFTNAKSLNYNAMTSDEKIKTKLMEHGMLVQFEGVVEGHTIDLYKYSPNIGLKMSKLLGYVADIEQVIGIAGVRVLAPIPNTSLIGFEVPRKNRTFPEVLPPQDPTNPFNVAIGVDVMGDTQWFDIRRAPHLLVAGATGSGKSVFLNSLLEQLAMIPNADLHLFDPKIVELARFRSQAVEYYTDPVDIYLALSELVREMNARYTKLAQKGARNIEEYGEGMRYKFVVIDEFGDLTVGNHVLEETVKTGEVFSRGVRAGEEKVRTEKVEISKEISRSILLLAQKARAAGIHLIVATQRPSVDIITGSIKANFPTKVAFRTAKAIDSQILIDEAGAEKLLGKGDMLFSGDFGKMRLQGFNS